MRNAYSAAGTAEPPLLRPSSSARSPVAVSEYSGSPVTARSTPAQTSGPIAASAAYSARCLHVACGEQPQPVDARQQPRLGAHEPRGGEQPHDDHGMAARPAQLDHRRPHDDGEVRDVDVAARREEREVEARHEQRRGRRADERREGGLAERVDGGDERQEREHAEGDHDAVRAVAERRQQRAEGDRQRVLGRRAVGGEGERVQADELAPPQQRVVRVVVGIRRVDEEADQRGERQRAHGDAFEHGDADRGQATAPRRGSLGRRRRRDGGRAGGAGHG